LLTEHQIAQTWRSLFRDGSGDEDTFAKAEALLDELRAESPLRHRLESELAELRRLRTKAAPRAT
jgi:hypothetical protein